VLPYLPKLHSLWLNSGHLTTVRPLNFSNLPSLKKLVLFGNQIHHLNDGDLHFDSPVLELVDLSENHLISISPNAIRGKWISGL
jgi:Leucine-rich repeat (LRR) protein